MGLDFYAKRRLDQVKNDFQVVDEIEKMNIDQETKDKLRQAKMELEMEQMRLKRENTQEKIENELSSNSQKSMDITSFPSANLSSGNSQSSNQEEPFNFNNKYSEEEVRQAKEIKDKNIKMTQDLLAWIEDETRQYDESESMEETTRHR